MRPRAPGLAVRLALGGMAALAMALAWAGAARAGVPLDPESTRDAREGLVLLYHGHASEAARAFERIRARHPESPAADFLLGGIEWHELITGPQGMVTGGPLEQAFLARLGAAIETGERRLETHPDDLSARFFLGGAYGYRARWHAMKESWWDAYRDGRRGVKHLETVVERDPDFADAYLGLGIYHYYADVIPSVLKVLAGIVGLGGDRERGLEEIRRALRDGELVSEEARFFLAEIHTTFEDDHWTALGYAASLRDEYPEDELFTWLHARVLDELHLADAAEREWRGLREAARGRRLEGFLLYRLARTALFGGDFAGAAEQLRDLLARDALGGPRMTAWGHLRYGQALDVLGRPEEALEQYRLVRDSEASGSAAERAAARVAAGRRDPSVVPLEELAEDARIVQATGAGDETLLVRLERMTTEPSRGLSREDRRRRFDILEFLADARIRRGDPEGAIAAIDRAISGLPRPTKEERSRLIARRARARLRAGDPTGARDDLESARARGDWDLRERVARELATFAEARAALAPPAADAARAAPAGRAVSAPDRGEWTLDVEVRAPDGPRRVPGHLADGRWTFLLPDAPTGGPLRYRFLVDGTSRRVDPAAARTVVLGDEAWSG